MVLPRKRGRERQVQKGVNPEEELPNEEGGAQLPGHTLTALGPAGVLSGRSQSPLLFYPKGGDPGLFLILQGRKLPL